MTAVDGTVTTFSLNGQPTQVRGTHPNLLEALREELGVTSPKDGCSPSGQCGCCTVLLDGKAVVSCQVSMERAEGKAVTTLEGLDGAERTRFADTFSACGALQCGFCTPGIVMRTKALLDKKGSGLTRDEASRHLGANLCRCTGYVKILDAVDELARTHDQATHPDHAGTPVAMPRTGGVGSAGIKYESRELSLGDRDYIDDMVVPGMLHGALVLTEHARAEIVALDTSAALAAPGVVAAFTAADIPGDLRVGIIHTDWPVMIPVGGRTSYLGDVLAIVVAETRQAARQGAALVGATYDVLRPITDAVAAIDDPEIAVWGTDSNVLSVSSYARGGDPGAAWEASAHRVHEVFQTQRIEHAFLEPESTLAVPGGHGQPLYVYSGGQGVWDDRDQIASVLGLDTDRVTVELVSNGGAFG
ncbi:MAG: molybdopterin-dependent oxidoreductase, partial [Acidimicrobiales bacterium]